jgi:hypothetical protein
MRRGRAGRAVAPGPASTSGAGVCVSKALAGEFPAKTRDFLARFGSKLTRQVSRAHVSCGSEGLVCTWSTWSADCSRSTVASFGGCTIDCLGEKGQPQTTAHIMNQYGSHRQGTMGHGSHALGFLICYLVVSSRHKKRRSPSRRISWRTVRGTHRRPRRSPSAQTSAAAMNSKLASVALGAGLAAYIYWRRSRRCEDSAQSEATVTATPPQAKKAPPPDAPPAPPPQDLHILHSGEFASEAAQLLARAISQHQSETTVHVTSMEDWKKWLADYALTERTTPLHAVFIVATIENEQPPETAGPLVRWSNRRTHAPDLLSGRLRFAVLGLGDSNLLLDRQTTGAKDCNQVARRLDARLAAIGAARCHACGMTDDRTGNTELEPWIHSFVQALYSSAETRCLEST